MDHPEETIDHRHVTRDTKAKHNNHCVTEAGPIHRREISKMGKRGGGGVKKYSDDG